MKQLFQKQFFSRLVTWHLRTLHSHSARVTPRALTEVLGTSAKLVNSTAASFIKDCPFTLHNPIVSKNQFFFTQQR
ncbi:hypothetical protein OS493_014077 [Desmophyllum pertusum]|uniref:Uncharacterized protein n=1 Tax=Desmophyllum pertusum TaxID=174260 RepID=A0A9W9ZFH0_9CNID|nr:hypothetical protein OS493_014077 [Desmophyllum pertusum]